MRRRPCDACNLRLSMFRNGIYTSLEVTLAICVSIDKEGAA